MPEIIILVGALAGGYVTGLTGFGTGLTALVTVTAKVVALIIKRKIG